MSQLKTNTTTIQSIIDKLSGKSIEDNDPNLNNTTISSNAAAAADIVSPKRAYVNGELLTGTMVDNGTVTKTLDTSTTSYTIPAGKHSGAGTVSISTQTKTVTPSTSSQLITPDSGKVLSSVSVGAIPSTYVQPSSTRAAQTITPGTSTQYISAGTYCSGQQTIQGDPDLIADNIKSGVNIFGVTGTCPKGFLTTVTASETSSALTFTDARLDSMPSAILISVTSQLVRDGLQCAAFIRAGSITGGYRFMYNIVTPVSTSSDVYQVYLTDGKLDIYTQLVECFVEGTSYTIACLWE